ncbi:MAG: hypothetical protein NUW37_09455 [Planctomycetes bacterium]|nr:hypothetical protein [Planctomycetota bacterium]
MASHRFAVVHRKLLIRRFLRDALDLSAVVSFAVCALAFALVLAGFSPSPLLALAMLIPFLASGLKLARNPQSALSSALAIDRHLGTQQIVYHFVLLASNREAAKSNSEYVDYLESLSNGYLRDDRIAGIARLRIGAKDAIRISFFSLTLALTLFAGSFPLASENREKELIAAISELEIQANSQPTEDLEALAQRFSALIDSIREPGADISRIDDELAQIEREIANRRTRTRAARALANDLREQNFGYEELANAIESGQALTDMAAESAADALEESGFPAPPPSIENEANALADALSGGDSTAARSAAGSLSNFASDSSDSAISELEMSAHIVRLSLSELAEATGNTISSSRISDLQGSASSGASDVGAALNPENSDARSERTTFIFPQAETATSRRTAVPEKYKSLVQGYFSNSGHED